MCTYHGVQCDGWMNMTAFHYSYMGNQWSSCNGDVDIHVIKIQMYTCTHKLLNVICILTFRFSRLLEPATECQQQLEDSLKLQQFYHEVEGEVQWIKEHEPLADSPDYGKSLTGVQNLQKKLQVRIHKYSEHKGSHCIAAVHTEILNYTYLAMF